MTAPANDNFADAIVLSGSLPITRAGDTNVDATLESGEPVYNAQSEDDTVGATVWYSWTALASGDVTVDLSGSDYDTVLGVYTGSAVDSLTLVEFNDDAPGYGRVSAVVFAATEGTTYRIQVGGYEGDAGEITLLLDAFTPPPPFFPPTVTPITLTGGSASISGTLDTAPAPGEPTDYTAFGFTGFIQYSAWWSVEAPLAGVFVFDTLGSGLDTTAAAYLGTEEAGLDCVAFNDNYEGGTATVLESRISWSVDSGDTSYIQVGAPGEEEGSFVGHISFSAYPTPETSDPPPDFTDADQYRVELRSLNSSGFDVTTESLELVSFSCNWRLNAPGAFEGTGVVGVIQSDAANVGARELIVYKADVAIWGGYLSYFDVDEDTRQVRISAEGYWSRARARLMRGNQIYKPLTNSGAPWKADVIAWDIIYQAQGATYGDMGWVYGGHTGTRKNCKRIYYGVDRNNIGDAIETLAREGFFDFAVDVRQSPAEDNVAMFRTWYKRGSNLTGSVNLSASNAMTLNYSLASTDMATVIDVFGSVEGCRGVAATAESGLSTYGRLEARPIDMETDEQAEVDFTASEFIAQNAVPAKNATVTYLEGVGPSLNTYDLGDTIRVSPADGYVSYFDGRVVAREIGVEAGRAVITVEVER